jgi:hypothetical protein
MEIELKMDNVYVSLGYELVRNISIQLFYETTISADSCYFVKCIKVMAFVLTMFMFVQFLADIMTNNTV